jgi:diguanylate cyclase (GGDEF)-like protein
VEEFRDSLTGVYSRAALQDRLQDEVARASRYQTIFSLIILDVDYFKTVNDAFGHRRGDEVLVEVVQRINEAIRESDLLFRYGGDEFVIFLPHTPKPEASVIAGRVLNHIRSGPFSGRPPLSLTASLGIASFPDEGQTPEALFERADRRAYEAKRVGRGLVVEDDPISGWSLTFDSQSRLLERELPLDTLQHFLAELPTQKRGLLLINGIPGAGNTRFTVEVAKAARLRGYLVLSVRGGEAIKTRLYGALVEAEIQSERLPTLTAGDTGFAQALQQLVEGNGNSGLLIVVDNLHLLDMGTWRVLQFILTSPFVAIAGLVCTTQNEAAYSLPDLPLQTKIDLLPLSLPGVHLLLRSFLRWEPPEALAVWLHQQTRGLPAILQRAVTHLLDQKLLTPSSEGWTIKSDYASTSLEHLIEAAPPPNNLPLFTTEFVGRADEMRVLKRDLGQHHLITIIAPGGTGKTRLGQQVAAELLEQFPAGVFVILLAAVSSSELILPTLMQAMGLGFAGRQDPKDALLSYLRELHHDLLLVLDNFEHLLDGSGLIADLRKSSPHVRLIITSRERINVPDMMHYELYGLPYPALGDVSDGFEQYGAVQLFQQAVRRTMSASRGEAAVTFSVRDRGFVQRVCAVVDGLPLGLELAAAWAPLFSYQEIAQQLEHNLDLLITSRSDVPARQRSARAVFDYFWDMLSEAEQHSASSLSVFRGGFDTAAARDVAGVSPFFLSALADRTFLTRTLEGRYTLHELLRQYIAGKLSERTADSQAVHHRHAMHYFAIAQNAEPELIIFGRPLTGALKTRPWKPRCG